MREPRAVPGSRSSRAALFAAIVAGCAPSMDAVEPRADQAVVRGVVRDQHRAPVRGAKVSIIATSGTPDHTYEVETDRMGRYQLVIPPGPHKLSFNLNHVHDGHVTYGGLLVDVDVSGGQTKELHPQINLRETMPGAKPYGAPPARRRLV